VKEREKNKDGPRVRCVPRTLPGRSWPAVTFTKWSRHSVRSSSRGEWNAEYRHIFTGTAPCPFDPHPFWSGYSSPNWTATRWYAVAAISCIKPIAAFENAHAFAMRPVINLIV
jgi:hypothetical protein